MKVVGFVLCVWLALPGRIAAAPAGSPIDSLQRLLAVAQPDTVRVNRLIELAAALTQIDPLATIAYGRQALQLAQQAGYVRGQSMALVRLGSGFREAGNYPAALQFGLKGLHLAEQLNSPPLVARALNALGYLNWEQGNSRAALFYLQRARAVAGRSHADAVLTRVLGNIGNVYQQLHQPDSALFFSHQGLALDLRNHDLSSEVGDAAMLGNIYASLGNLPLAERYYRYSLHRARGGGFTFALCRAYLGQARMFYSAAGHPADSALYFARQALLTARQGNYPRGQFEAAQFLATALAARHDTAAAFRYLRLANATRDTLFSATKISQMQALDVGERLRLSELDIASSQAAAHRRQAWLLAALVAALPALVLLGYYGRQRQRANQQLNARNAELETQREELHATLARLEETQAQLVQREKMAFLGELTAGIAHELQNPLAFVQNFADVSAMLVDDITGEGATPAADNGHELLLAGLKRNLREISQHGQRATSIISSMLARSRGVAAPCTPTDLNALALEYLRMAYQGLRAKDKSFVAARTTHLAPHLPPVAVVAPDLGRVLLNLFTNAFYAVQQRRQRGEAGYTPTISLRTSLLPSGHVEIRVRDNGPGIPAAVQANIFQPFFTTKPSGEGTGLGLALAHDIVVRDHGGTLTVESCENEFTEFSICLPGPAPQ
ncbi:MAG: ATP-binding protein [Bacteroidota bacterium]|nr:ATP-binding protein [Bacteroidota bacterium]